MASGVDRRLSGIAMTTAALALVAILFGCGGRSNEATTCSLMTAIAGDAQKMQHVKEWIASRLRDTTFRESLREDPILGHSDKRFREFGNMDWKYLGITEGAGVMEFDLGRDDSGWWDVDRIYSARLWMGRTAIVFQLAPEMNPESTHMANDPKWLNRMSEDVSVFCGSSR